MGQIIEVVRWVSTGLFVLLAAVSGLVAYRRRRPAAYWACATFVAVGAVTVLGRVTPDDPPLLVQKLTILLLLVFPWALFRFTATFGALARGLVRLVDGVVVVLALALLALPEIDGADAALASPFGLFVLAFVTVWVTLTLLVAVRLWRAGRGEPTLTRRRMRLLAGGAGTMSLALVAAAYVPGGAESPTSLTVQLLAVAAGLAFLVGLAPPPILRTAWRENEERQLYTATLKLMTATTRDEVARPILPDVAAVVGASAARIVAADGAPVATHGTPPPEGRGAVEAPAGDATVQVWPSPYAPFFGEEETRVMRRLALLTGLAFERAEALERERAAREQLEAANAELEAFVYSASHDLKSPLIAMIGYLDVVKQDHGHELNEQAHRYLERMVVNGTYMEALIDDLLELSRVGRVDTELAPVRLDEVAHETARDLATRYPRADIRVGAMPAVWFNPARARQLFTNLIENACRYGGRPEVRVDVFAHDGGDGAVSVVVADDGVGIPDEYRERVFGVFERLDSDKVSGTGIGLAICTKIAEVAGGGIELVPTERGARFVVSLPASIRVDGEAPQEVPT